MAWWYNTESGALTSAGGIQSFLQQIQGDVGLGAGWHHLNIADNATGDQAAAEAKKEFPNGATPTTSVGQQVVQEVAQETGFSGLSDIGKIGAMMKAFYDAITNGKMWRSLGWLLLGAVLIIIGLGLWLGKDAVKEIGPSLPVIGGFL